MQNRRVELVTVELNKTVRRNDADTARIFGSHRFAKMEFRRSLLSTRALLRVVRPRQDVQFQLLKRLLLLQLPHAVDVPEKWSVALCDQLSADLRLVFRYLYCLRLLHSLSLYFASIRSSIFLFHSGHFCGIVLHIAYFI